MKSLEEALAQIESDPDKFIADAKSFHAELMGNKWWTALIVSYALKINTVEKPDKDRPDLPTGEEVLRSVVSDLSRACAGLQTVFELGLVAGLLMNGQDD